MRRDIATSEVPVSARLSASGGISQRSVPPPARSGRIDLDPGQRALAHREPAAAQDATTVAEVGIVTDQHRPFRVARVGRIASTVIEVERAREALVDRSRGMPDAPRRRSRPSARARTFGDVMMASAVNSIPARNGPSRSTARGPCRSAVGRRRVRPRFRDRPRRRGGGGAAASGRLPAPRRRDRRTARIRSPSWMNTRSEHGHALLLGPGRLGRVLVAPVERLMHAGEAPGTPGGPGRRP